MTVLCDKYFTRFYVATVCAQGTAAAAALQQRNKEQPTAARVAAGKPERVSSFVFERRERACVYVCLVFSLSLSLSFSPSPLRTASIVRVRNKLR